jgi:microcystin-dependent protein
MTRATRTPGAPPGDKPIVPLGEFPIGTVVPYTSTVDSGQLSQQGWLYCDGRALSRETYADLFLVIGTLHGGGDNVRTFNLPDYRGWFQRGVDDGTGRDPDAKDRIPAAPGGHSGDYCGSAQRPATALPTVPFSVAEDGSHTHQAPHMPTGNSSYHTAGTYQAEWNPNSSATESAGEHSHEVGSGDPESRPTNANVAFVIRYRI